MTGRLRYNNQNNFVMHPLMPADETHPDKNDRFVVRKCATYLHRYLSRHFVLDEEAMEFMCWILGEEKVRLSKKMIEFAAERYKQEMAEDFSACDADQFAGVAFRAIRHIRFIHRSDLGRIILGLLEKKAENAAYRGHSDLEQNIKKVKKIFALSENEAEALVFFYISSMYEPPDDFFNRHLACSRFPGRKHLKNILAMDHYELSRVLDGSLIKTGMVEQGRTKMALHHEIVCALQAPPESDLASRFFLPVPKKPTKKGRIEKAYSLDGLHTTGDLPFLFTQLDRFDQYLRNGAGKDVRNLNLLFYGPPGTGKSELARYIAAHLDRELLCRRSSDLLDPYVGMSEKNICKAFEQAEQEEAVLVMDEVDSMLFPRESAHRSWEISFTNEFLARMERFKGILICTTNRLTGMDSAAIRRFNQKIGFGYLLPDGNAIFYQKLLQPLINAPMGQKAEKALLKLANLAPGDFRTVRDRYAFFPAEELSHEMLIGALQEEAAIKDVQKGSRPIGFH